MKYLHELLTRILSGENAGHILLGLTPQNKGHIEEAMLRLLVLLGIHPTKPSSSVIPYQCLPTTGTLGFFLPDFLQAEKDFLRADICY